MSLTWFNLKKNLILTLFSSFCDKVCQFFPSTYLLPPQWRNPGSWGTQDFEKEEKKKHTLQPSFGCVWPSDEILVNVKEFDLYNIYILAIMAVLTLTTGLLPVVSVTLWILHMENSRSKESIRHQRVQFWVAWWSPHCSALGMLCSYSHFLLTCQSPDSCPSWLCAALYFNHGLLHGSISGCSMLLLYYIIVTFPIDLIHSCYKYM